MKDETKRKLRATLAPMGRRVDKAYAQVEAGDEFHILELLEAIAADVAYMRAALLADAKGEG